MLEAKSAVAEYELRRTQVFPHLRLGLAHGQLHLAEKDRVMRQFQGRAGRGSQQSYCYLLSKEASATASERLRTLERTTNGFALAEMDLRMRVPGDFFSLRQSSLRQSGLPELKVASMADTRLMAESRTQAEWL